MPEYNSQTLRALEDSIAHWKRLSTNSQEPGEAPSSRDCALCRRFLHAVTPCEGCPIFDKTGARTCGRTPYRSVAVNWDWKNKKPRDEFFRQALLMLNFLITLRKEILQ